MSVNSKMTAIADAIRAKTGGTGLLTLDDMAQDIATIDTSENLDEVLDEQDALIADIKAALEDKGANSNPSNPTKPEQTKTVRPSLSQQIISPDSGYTLSEVIVEPITSGLLTSLDPDFKPENIAKDKDLFGLIGTMAGTMQIAKGTVSFSADFNMDEEYITCEKTVTGLAFKPKFVCLFSQENLFAIVDSPDNVFVAEATDPGVWDEYWISHFLIGNVDGTIIGNIVEANWYNGSMYSHSGTSLTGVPTWFSFINDGFSISIAGALAQTSYFNGSYDWYAIG